jgi:hypothetical protein
MIFALFNLAALMKAFPQGFDTKIQWFNISIFSSVDEIIEAYGAGDAGLLLQVSRDFAEFTNISEQMYGIFGYWTPGLPIIQVPLIWLNQISGVPLYLSLLLVNMVIWNLVIYYGIRLFTSLKLLTLFGFIFVTFILSFEFFWFFRAGVFFTEGPAFGILLIALFMATNSLINGTKTSHFLIVGALLGISLVIRHTNEYAIYIGLILSTLYVILRLALGKSPSEIKKQTSGLFILYILGFIVTLPWRIIRVKFYEQNTWTLSSVNREIWTFIWQTDDSEIGKYWGESGGNWACRLDTVKCALLNSLDLNTISSSNLLRSAISSIVEDPVSYLQLRLNSVDQYYFYISYSTIAYQNLFPYLSIFGILVIIFLFVRIKNSIKWPVLILWLPFILTNLISYAFVHFESRYFISFRLCILGLMLSLSSLYFSNQRTKVR